MTEVVKLGTVLRGIQAGKSFQTAEVLARPDELGVLKVSAVTWSDFQPDEAKALVGTYEPEEAHKVKNGDLLISRANTKEFVGAVVLVEQDYPLRLLSDKTLRLVLDETRVSKEYLLFALRSASARKHIEHFATGTSDSMRNISQGVIESIPIPLPGLNHQQRLARGLKDQLAAMETTRKAVQAQLAECAALKSKALESVFNSVPDQRPIGSVAKVQSGFAFKSSSFQQKGIRLLRNTNVLPGRVYWDESVFLNETEGADFSNYVLNAGDVLISLDRPIISTGTKVARVGDVDLPSLLVQRVGRFLIDSERLDADYLFAYLQTDLFASKISGHDQSLGVPHISPSQVEALQMPLPSPSVQKRLAKRLNEIASIWDEAVSAIQAQMSDLKRLPSAILAQSFGS